MHTAKPLEPRHLYRHCDAGSLAFETTAELPDLGDVVGQERAMEALRFGVSIRREGFNLYVLGPPGTGKHTVVRAFLERRAAGEPRPTDWCYVNNFDRAHQPTALRLPAGRGSALARDMLRLVESLKSAIPATFESEEYRVRAQEIEDDLKERREAALADLARDARDHGAALIRTPAGFAFAPLRESEVLSPEEFHKLPLDDQDAIESRITGYQERLAALLRQVPQWRREAQERTKALDSEIAMSAVGHMIEELKRAYADVPAVDGYLEAVQRDVVGSVDQFRTSEDASPLLGLAFGGRDPFRRYRVNALVDHGATEGAPVVYEDNPLFPNLIGRVEHEAQMGALVTDFSLLKGGALHRANGGYLILEARKVLMQPYAWEGLKRALFSRQINIESLARVLGLASTASLEPEPIPLDVKVVLLGDRRLYYLLHALDPEFGELFKVASDFADHIDRSPENDILYARLIGTLARRESLRPLEAEAAARIIEQSAKMAGDASRLSTHMGSVLDLLSEADHLAAEADRTVVPRADVEGAVSAQVRRQDRVRQRIYEEIAAGMLMIETSGERIGQVNGLSVLQLGGFAFGRPSRITATARLGDGKLVDIEREVELGGAIHSKGVLILSAYLASRYSSGAPLSLTASLVFEQSYGPIDGDSASVGELCALLSALARVPVRQGLAITGSVNQHGEVQPIGGVNEKIEGFFDVCRQAGLDGTQGVLIPAANVRNLMLRQDVVAAATEGRFHVFPVATVDEALTLLCGRAAGEVDAAGEFPEGTVNHAVLARLRELTELRRSFVRGAEGSPRD